MIAHLLTKDALIERAGSILNDQRHAKRLTHARTESQARLLLAKAWDRLHCQTSPTDFDRLHAVVFFALDNPFPIPVYPEMQTAAQAIWLQARPYWV